MKNLKVAFIALLLTALAACSGNKCKDVVCGFNQTCLQGNCICVDGYEGPNCDVASAPKYEGQYTAYEVCSSGASNPAYSPYIQPTNFRPGELQISGFLGQYNITAFIRGDVDKTGNFLEIPQQSLGGGSIYGQGLYQKVGNQTRITLNLEYTLGFDNKACTHTLSR